MKCIILPGTDGSIIAIDTIEYVSATLVYDYKKSSGSCTIYQVGIKSKNTCTVSANFTTKESADIWRTNLLRLLCPNKTDIIDLSTETLFDYDNCANDFITIHGYDYTDETDKLHIRVDQISSVSSVYSRHCDDDPVYVVDTYMKDGTVHTSRYTAQEEADKCYRLILKRIGIEVFSTQL